MEMKQVILVRADLKMPKGKMAAQVAHAAVEAVFRSPDEKVDKWYGEGQKKVVLKVENEKELVKFFQMAKDQGFSASLITDAGHTVLPPNTKTCVGIGPDDEEALDALTGELKMV